MALPTVVKTWQYNVNQSSPATGNTSSEGRQVALLIKNSMIGFASTPWTVRYSCNSVTAGTAGDGVDRITTTANIVNAAAGVAHSWIVLRQTGMGLNYELCFDFSTANAYIWSTVISYGAGFTGGSTTARPTATDEVVLALSGAWKSNASNSNRVHVLQASDGSNTHVFVTDSNGSFSWLPLMVPSNTVTGWSTPTLAAMFGGSGAAGNSLASSVWAPAAGVFTMRAASTTGIASLACEGNAGGVLPALVPGSVPNDLDSAWPMLPLSTFGITTGMRGRNGTIVDLWAGSANVPTGDTYPNNTTYQFCQFGSVIVPWNGTLPLLA